MSKPITIWRVWDSAFNCMKANISSIQKISLFSFFIPSFCIFLFLAILSQPVVNQIRIKSTQAVIDNTQLSYETLVLETTHFLALTAFLSVLSLIFFLLSYLSFIQIGLTYIYKNSILSAKEAYSQALKFFFPKGLLITLLVIFIFLVERLYLGNIYIFSVFSLMSYVLCMAEKTSVFTSLTRSIFFRYTSPATGGGITVGLMLLVISIFATLLGNSLGYFLDFILHWDEIFSFSKSLWATSIPGLPFSLIFGISHIVMMLFVISFLVIIANLSVCIFSQSAKTPNRPTSFR